MSAKSFFLGMIGSAIIYALARLVRSTLRKLGGRI